MSTIERFEEIEAWKRARILSNEIYQITFLRNFSKDFGLKDQITRASGSVMDNIAEGFERGGNKEFIQFLFIAKGSIGEVRSQLYRAKDLKYISETQFREIYNLTVEIGKLVGGLIKYLSNSKYKGTKYKP
ncbi:MAG: four helix bundle protein [Bacteroidales bacterium]|nr:four helix bundle protein [Bacteroidales bacterium]